MKTTIARGLGLTIGICQAMYGLALFIIHFRFPGNPEYAIAFGVLIPIVVALFALHIGRYVSRFLLPAVIAFAPMHSQPAKSQTVGVVAGVGVIIVGGYVVIEVIDYTRQKLNPQGVQFWPPVIYADTNCAPLLQGTYNLVKNRSMTAGGGYYKGPNASVWLMPMSGNFSDKNCSCYWVVTDALGAAATTIYAASFLAPGEALADDWNHGNNNPATGIFNGGSLMPAWPNITNVQTLAVGFKVPPSITKKSLGSPQILMGQPDYIGLDTSLDAGDWVSAMSSYGVEVSVVLNNPNYLYDGGSWGYNSAPANYGSGGGLPGITNVLWMDYSSRTLKIDPAAGAANGGTIAAVFRIENWETGMSTNNHRVTLPITVTGSSGLRTCTIQKSRDNRNWSNVLTLQIVSDGTVQFIDPYADPQEFYRVVGVGQ